MNTVLISKWKWRILTDKEAVWREILEARYGNLKLKVLIRDISVVEKSDSIWWRDLVLSDNYANLHEDHFSGAVAYTFVESCWRWNAEAIFSAGCDWTAEGFLPAVSAGTGGQQQVMLATLQEKMMAILQQHSPREVGDDDEFTWRLNNEGVFSVKSCYVCFKEKLSGPAVNQNTVKALTHLWKIKVPSKILFFGWRFIHNRIAAKDQLIKRGILVEGNDSLCVFCHMEEESLMHLFWSCEVSLRIWRRVYEWFGAYTNITLKEFLNFFHHCEKLANKTKRTIGARLVRVYGVVIGCDNSSVKEEGFSLQVDLGSTVWKSAYMVGFLLIFKQTLKIRAKLCGNCRR
ncbi:uncharacterized protein LOC131629651 [Vicia villosa]|uniref:uncharacterized protein LOC131629651 n=1 Tax=Vicia villosa TaxID=3911 RepID=UPI00273A8CBB|nr:uncharacterized protein LOC131629651 [Vicia villosa]